MQYEIEISKIWPWCTTKEPGLLPSNSSWLGNSEDEAVNGFGKSGCSEIVDAIGNAR